MRPGSVCEWRNPDESKRAGKSDFYHWLWFWDCDDLPVGSFRQKLFLLEAVVGRFRVRRASTGCRDGCPYATELARRIAGHKAEQFTPELLWHKARGDPLTQWFGADAVVGRLVGHRVGFKRSDSLSLFLVFVEATRAGFSLRVGGGLRGLGGGCLRRICSRRILLRLRLFVPAVLR